MRQLSFFILLCGVIGGAYFILHIVPTRVDKVKFPVVITDSPQHTHTPQICPDKWQSFDINGEVSYCVPTNVSEYDETKLITGSNGGYSFTEKRVYSNDSLTFRIAFLKYSEDCKRMAAISPEPNSPIKLKGIKTIKIAGVSAIRKDLIEENSELPNLVHICLPSINKDIPTLMIFGTCNSREPCETIDAMIGHIHFPKYLP